MFAQVCAQMFNACWHVYEYVCEELVPVLERVGKLKKVLDNRNL